MSSRIGMGIVLLLSTVMTSYAADRYASPTGSGSTCSSGVRCSLTTAISQAQAGESVILGNGTYAVQLKTARSGTAGNSITIVAENMHQAFIRPGTSSVPSRANVTFICHSYITIRGLVINGDKVWHRLMTVGGSVSSSECPSSAATVIGTVVEENQMMNSGAVGLEIGWTTGLLVRHNLINGTGYFSDDPCCGEGVYASGTTGEKQVIDLLMYGNTWQDTTGNNLDLKHPVGVKNAFIHHNIFEGNLNPLDHRSYQGRQSSNDGCIIMLTINTEFDDNIVRNNKCGPEIFKLSPSANNKIRDNVAYGGTIGSIARRDTTGGAQGLALSEITGNTYCNLSTYANHSDGIAGIDQHDENFNRPQSECDAEVTRITTEAAALPRFTAIPTIDPPTGLTVISITE